MIHDEVSDTENIRKNLAIERMIVEGCDILLDTSQTFVRQGELLSLYFMLYQVMLFQFLISLLILIVCGQVLSSIYHPAVNGVFSVRCAWALSH